MVAVISVDAYLFLAFSDLTCHLEDTEIGEGFFCFFSFNVLPDSKETKVGSSDQEAAPSASKMSG